MNYLIIVLILTFFAIITPGCAIIDQGKPKEPEKPPVTFIYTFDANGKPIESGRVAENVKIDIQVTDPDTKEKMRTQIDAGGWILVKPSGPAQVK